MFGRHLFSAAVISDTGVVDENIDAVPPIEDFGNCGRNFVCSRDVAPSRHDIDAEPASFASHLLESNLVDIDQEKFRAFLSQPQRDRPANSRCGARYQCSLPANFTHW